MHRGSRRFRFSPSCGDTIIEYCGKYTVGHDVGRGSRSGYRPLSCGDRAGVLPAPAGDVVVAVGCTVLQTWRDCVLWALQVRTHTEIPDPSRGRSRPPAASAGHPPLRGARGDTGPLPEREAGPGPCV